MSAPVLSITEQKAAVSGKKKKKKTVKNVLGIPNNQKSNVSVVNLTETENLTKILERLLPSARLPIQQNPKRNKEPRDETPEETKLKSEIMSRRNQLSLGVNALNRSIRKGLISAALIASDVQPKFLVHHINVLCTHNKIPFLYMPELREITKNCLGFPCIALGFKKDFFDFSEAVNEINLILQTKTVVESSTEIAIKSSSEESDEEETEEISVQPEEQPFMYLQRNSTKERAFVPDSCKKDKVKPEGEFITVAKDNNTDLKNNQSPTGISSNVGRKRNRKPRKFKSLKIGFDDDDDDEDLEVPKKKKKKDWVIDRIGTKPSYYPAKLMRVPSNPDRPRKK